MYTERERCGRVVPDNVEARSGQGASVPDTDLVHVLVMAPGHNDVIQTTIRLIDAVL